MYWHRAGLILAGCCLLLAGCAEPAGHAGAAMPPAPEATTAAIVEPESGIDHRLADAYDRWAGRGITELSPERRAAVLAVADDALARFRPAPAFFEDDHRLLVLLALASRHIDHGARDETFLHHAVYLLGNDDIERPADWPDRHHHGGLTPEAVDAAYAEFADPALTDRLGEAIADHDWLAPVRRRLRLSAQDEQPFRLVVLDFDSGDDRAGAFARRIGRADAWLPPLWVHGNGSNQYLAFTRRYAEELLSLDHLSADDQERAIALIAHEYVHTQGDIGAGRLGFLFEERRAERLSGDRHGYLEVKQFFIYLRVVTGYDILPVIQTHPRDASAIYADIARTLGLATLAELACAFPQPYLDQPTESMTVLVDTLGSRDGVLARLLERELAAGRQAPMNDRFRARIDDLSGILGRDRVRQDIEHQLAQRYLLPTMAGYMLDLLDAADRDGGGNRSRQ